MTGWMFLAAAILLEVAGTTAMKFSNGFTQIVPSVMLFVCYTLSFTALTFALKYLEVSVAYAIWAGTGTALIAGIGILYFSEPISLIRILSVGLIIMGVVGLNLTGLKH